MNSKYIHLLWNIFKMIATFRSVYCGSWTQMMVCDLIILINNKTYSHMCKVIITLKMDSTITSKSYILMTHTDLFLMHIYLPLYTISKS